MEAKQSDLIPGYSHPVKTVSSRGTKYKTFTEGQKSKKKEQFGSIIVAGNKYASYNTSQQTSKTQQEIEKERQTFEKMNNQQGGK